MNLAPRRPLLGLPEQEPDRAPVYEVDAAAGLILGANRAGWQAWGVDPAAVAPPLPIDRAMPALTRLRALPAGVGAEPQRDEALTFWAARGLLHLVCLVEALGPPARFRVRAVCAEPASGFAAEVPEADRARPRDDIALPARLAHELRTPLGAVIAYAEVLKDEHFGPHANPRYRCYARDIYQSARHALGVIDAMLGDPQRAGRRQLCFTDLEPAVVVEGCVAVARPLAEGAGLELEANYADGLPRLIADEVSLRQMLLNLLTNAVKFARAGDRIAVAVACEGDGPLDIVVADTGPGMEPGAGSQDDCAHGRRGKGLGLGLPLTRALAEANGASLTVDSAPGKGTRVTISFRKDRLVPV